MSILRIIPWKVLAELTPEIVDLMRSWHDADANDRALAELRDRVKKLEERESALAARLAVMKIVIGMLAVVSVASLIIGIILAAR